MLQGPFPHAKSGRLHSCHVAQDFRLYFHRLFRRNDQPGRTFMWAFFIAEHSGPHINDVLDLQKFVVPYDQWKGRGISVQVDDLSGSWAEIRGSAVTAESRMRIRVSAVGRDEEKFHFLFPSDADFPIDYQILEYTGEDAPTSDVYRPRS